MPALEDLFREYIEVWNSGAVDRLAGMLDRGYVGHMRGQFEQERDAAALAVYIADFRRRFPDLTFVVLGQLASGDQVASRLAATRDGHDVATGMNFSRWSSGLLAEEWALWSPIS